ncbi:MAG: methionine gamma-lyase family protein [Roseburia sp.]
MIVGSLIKNPGGGLAPIGGYIVGKKECVENAAYRLTSPGLGKEVGASLGVIQSFLSGIFPGTDCGRRSIKRRDICREYL